MLFMVIERFRDADAVYDRFEKKGRMLPTGVTYINSWVEPKRERCFQLMESESLHALENWARSWEDLVEFEFVEVVASR